MKRIGDIITRNKTPVVVEDGVSTNGASDASPSPKGARDASPGQRPWNNAPQTSRAESPAQSSMKRIGDFLTRLKTPVVIENNVSYKRLTIRINHNGVSLRDTVPGVSIGTKNQFRVCAGDFILSKIDARQGAFGIVPAEADGGIITGNFWTYRVDTKLVNTDWFLQFTNTDDFLELCRRSSTGNTHRKYLDEEIFLNHELEIPSLKDQLTAVVSCNSGKERVEEIQQELTHQETLLGQLQQAILQEAIQGKLTADWRAAHPATEPARALLHRIQAERARLIAAKKIRPPKPLPPITPAEIPFAIPKTWERIHVGDLLVESAKNGLSIKGSPEPPGVAALRLNALTQNGNLDFDQRRYLQVPPDEVKEILIKEGDFFVARGNGSLHLLARGGVAGAINEDVIFPDTMIRLRFFGGIADWANIAWRTGPVRKQLESKAKTAAGIYKISQDSLLRVVVPLPPLAEQATLVARVAALQGSVRQLAAEIAQSRTHAAHLLQAVLQAAFTPAQSPPA